MGKRKFKITSKIVLIAAICVISIATVAMGYIAISKAEQSGGTPNSGVTSRIKTIYDALSASSYGSDAAGGWGNWGAYWNRIYSAATWVPSDNAALTDVKNGKTFENTSRTQRTGTYPNPTNCSTQQYHDSYGGSVTETTNCSLTWTTAGTPVSGDDDRTDAPNPPTATRGGYDPRTGLTWSQLLLNSSGTVVFSHASNSTWNWDGTLKFTVTAATAAVGDTYTNNGQTFTVAYAIAGATTLYAKPASSGLPAASGNLVRVTGSGTDPIVFSAYTLYGDNVAVGSKTASQLCSDRGNGWRLPTEKELMQAYIDGSYFNLTQPSNAFWSVTESSSTYAWYVYLNYGTTSGSGGVKSTGYGQVRCVR